MTGDLLFFPEILTLYIYLRLNNKNSLSNNSMSALVTTHSMTMDLQMYQEYCKPFYIFIKPALL